MYTMSSAGTMCQVSKGGHCGLRQIRVDIHVGRGPLLTAMILNNFLCCSGRVHAESLRRQRWQGEQHSFMASQLHQALQYDAASTAIIMHGMDGSWGAECMGGSMALRLAPMPWVLPQGGGLSEEACCALEACIVSHLAPRPRTGVQLYRQAISNLRILPVGCDG